MKRNRSEEGQCPKSNLERRLFEDTLRLLPNAVTDKPNLCTTDNSVTEASSSPNLIIEKEKNRHDESEEFYKGLEVRMKKLHKKSFNDLEDDSNDESEELYKGLQVRMNKLHKKSFNDLEDDSNDESEEFYKGLQVRMNKWHKKSFNESEDDSYEDTQKLLKSVDYNDSGVLEEDVCDKPTSQCILLDSSTGDSEYQTFASELNETVLIEREILVESQEHNGMVKSDSSTSIAREIVTTQAIVHEECANYDIGDLNNDFIEYQRVSTPISTKRNKIINRPPENNVFFSSKLDLHREQADYVSLVVKQENINQASEVDDEVEVVKLAARKIKMFSPIPKEKTSSKDTESGSSIIMSSSETDMYPSSSKCNILNKAIYSFNTENSAMKLSRSSSTDSEEPPNKRKRYQKASVNTAPMKGKKNMGK